MVYDQHNPPVLEQGQPVVADLPGFGQVEGVIVGMVTDTSYPFPICIIQCTDDTFPNNTYKYSNFSYPLSLIELR